jgi:hypothetical protein
MTILDPSNPIYAIATEEDRAAARRQWHHERFRAQLERSTLPQLPRDNLTFGRFSQVEDTTDGRLYRVRHDMLGDLELATGVVAYYFDRSGVPRLLEEPPGPQSRQALQEQQAAREQPPKPRPSWMTR